LDTVRIGEDDKLEDGGDAETAEKLRREREARAQALTLEMVGDLPFAEVKPPENVLFVCKLNPVTTGMFRPPHPSLQRANINPQMRTSN
jgi:peptidyl-prolyl cis-trans isomerase-like 4